MCDLPLIVQHIAHANAVQGGARLFHEMTTVLGVEQSRDPQRLSRRVPLSAEVRVQRVGKRERRSASSAEGMRALKASLGVPSRPIPRDCPVDVWARAKPPGRPA